MGDGGFFAQLQRDLKLTSLFVISLKDERILFGIILAHFNCTKTSLSKTFALILFSSRSDLD